MGIESFVLDLIEGKRKSILLEIFFYSLSLGYRALIASRNFLYDAKILRSYKSTLPVISVGNLVAGGTGKTPFAQKLSQELSSKPREVAIVTRGYRSKSESTGCLASLGDGPLVPSSLCGDEAYWLALHTKASIWTGKNRKGSLQKALESKAHIVILEDGFQHRQVQRDIDIVLLSAKDLFGKGYFLPRGYLRESPKSLKRANYIVITQIDPESCKEEILEKIRTFSKAEVVGFSSQFALNSSVKGKKVGAFCGLAKPESFYKALSFQTEIVKTLTLSDHQKPSFEALTRFALECQKQGAECLVCTEKDQVKLLNTHSLPLPIEVLKMSLTCVWNENVWKEMVRSIQTRI
jgi:tetraacyldisaccharide 4'-kinase